MKIDVVRTIRSSVRFDRAILQAKMIRLVLHSHFEYFGEIKHIEYSDLMGCRDAFIKLYLTRLSIWRWPIYFYYIYRKFAILTERNNVGSFVVHITVISFRLSYSTVYSSLIWSVSSRSHTLAHNVGLCKYFIILKCMSVKFEHSEIKWKHTQKYPHTTSQLRICECIAYTSQSPLPYSFSSVLFCVEYECINFIGIIIELLACEVRKERAINAMKLQMKYERIQFRSSEYFVSSSSSSSSYVLLLFMVLYVNLRILT